MLLVNKDEYIVKVRDANIKINGPKYEKKYKMCFIILLVLACIGILYSCKSIAICLILIIASIVPLSENWKLKIENRENLYTK